MSKKKKFYLIILAIIGALFVASYVKHLIQGDAKQEKSEKTDVSEACKGMHLAYGAEDTTALILIQEELQKNYPDAPQLDTVTTYLKELRDKYAVINAQRAESFRKLTKDEDKFEHTTWYKNSLFTHNANSNHLSLYIGQKENDIWLRLFISYCGDDWIFFDKAQVLMNDYACTIPFDRHKDKDTDNSGGKVWEWIDVPVDEVLMQGICNLASPELTTCKLRLSGKYAHERDITPAEKKAFQQVLDGYMYLLSQGNTGIAPNVE